MDGVPQFVAGVHFLNPAVGFCRFTYMVLRNVYSGWKNDKRLKMSVEKSGGDSSGSGMDQTGFPWRFPEAVGGVLL